MISGSIRNKAIKHIKELKENNKISEKACNLTVKKFDEYTTNHLLKLRELPMDRITTLFVVKEKAYIKENYATITEIRDVYASLKKNVFGYK